MWIWNGVAREVLHIGVIREPKVSVYILQTLLGIFNGKQVLADGTQYLLRKCTSDVTIYYIFIEWFWMEWNVKMLFTAIRTSADARIFAKKTGNHFRMVEILEIVSACTTPQHIQLVLVECNDSSPGELNWWCLLKYLNKWSHEQKGVPTRKNEILNSIWMQLS